MKIKKNGVLFFLDLDILFGFLIYVFSQPTRKISTASKKIWDVVFNLSPQNDIFNIFLSPSALTIRHQDSLQV